MIALDPPREWPIACPRGAVLWERRAAGENIVLVERTDGGTSFSAELGDETPYFLEVREGRPPRGAPDLPDETLLGPLLARLDLDGEEMLDRLDARTVLYGEAPDDVLLCAELALEGGAHEVTRLRPGNLRREGSER